MFDKIQTEFLKLSQPSINIRHVRNEFTLISPRPLGLLLKIGHFQVPAGLCIKTRLSAQPYKTHFHKKGCVLGLVLKVRVFLHSEVAYWPIADRRVYSNDPKNNSRTHFSPSSLLICKVANVMCANEETLLSLIFYNTSVSLNNVTC